MSKRASIAMNDQEVADFLAGRHVMNMATIGPTGQHALKFHF